MVQSLIAYVVKWINASPSKNGISITMIPVMIVEGKGNPKFNHKRITFGSYAMVYTVTKNDTKRRIIPAIELNESNDHVGHYFMSIYTGKRMYRYQWTKLPIDYDVIDQVRDLAEVEDAKKIADYDPIFEWTPGVLITDDVSKEDITIRVNNNEP